MVQNANRMVDIYNRSRSRNSVMASSSKSWLSCFKQRRDGEDEISPNLLKNGGVLLQKLIATFGGRYQNPIHYFTAEQLTRATNHFTGRKFEHAFESIFRGSLDGRSILVTKYRNDRSTNRVLDLAITNLVVSSQLSHLKNVLKFIGCCLEFEYPVLVYEAAGPQLLADFFTSSNDDKFLPWKSRVKIAKDIASTLTYLHTAFSTPIIHRDVHLSNVIIDHCGHAKLFNFSLSISLPPGKKQVEDQVAGTHGYIDPEYLLSGKITPKVDVYNFGILLFMLLVGGKQRMTESLTLGVCDTFYQLVLAVVEGRSTKGRVLDLGDTIHPIVDHNTLVQIVDCKIWEPEEDTQFRAFLDLALRCTEKKGEDRPDMIDVAKELRRIEKNELISTSI